MDRDTAAAPVLVVTSSAASKARSLAERDGRPGACLRLRVVPGGCSGLSYELGFDDAPTDEDHVIEVDGFRVVVDPRSAELVEGSTLDFDASLMGGGLKVRNPRAVDECACGDSFSV